MLLVKNFYSPKSIEEALVLLKTEQNSKLIAGGTDLIIDLRNRKITPEALIDISGIKDMQNIWEEGNILHIGTAATFSSIENNALVKKYCPCLCDAASQVGAVQIRNRATLGGNVANSASAADGVPSLLSMDAMAVIKSENSSRILPVSEILRGNSINPLKNDEMITEFQIENKPNSIKLFEKIGRRKALAISRINLAICIEIKDELVKTVCIAIGAVGLTPYRVKEVEDFLVGKKLSMNTIEDSSNLIEEVVAENLAGRSSTPYKRKIAWAVLNRALLRCIQGEKNE